MKLGYTRFLNCLCLNKSPSHLLQGLEIFRGLMTNEKGHEEKLYMEAVVPQSALILFSVLKALLQAADPSDHQDVT